MSKTSPTIDLGLLDESTVAAVLGVCVRTLKRWRDRGEGPPHLHVGRAIYYRRSLIEAWLAAREKRAA